MATAPGTELDKRTGAALDTHDEPSVEWGWHGHFPRATKIMGWVSVIAMLGMLIGNHTGWNEDVYLILTAVFMAGALIRWQIKDRTSWRN
ncbi:MULTISPECIES: DUF2631 domain-containing protein [unclassified Crossiella]|uniref:DUF2631 domain-containing protein n=1 Tax=unclassified Crossiella TaxID=2620835 RepID=UPI0020004612|nr:MULTISPECIES: DUF2631 domain-containing protein [unclassified Crossiella]MCK2242498.1 DUF2631 domain-containing protein [Crossiella sp. S99.2]MCK2254472.1 DUF2631 domain-containing protein [Crossiella sp. S99.1]